MFTGACPHKQPTDRGYSMSDLGQNSLLQLTSAFGPFCEIERVYAPKAMRQTSKVASCV